MRESKDLRERERLTMNKQETLKIINVLMSYYPDTFKGLSDEQTTTFIEIWHKSFSDNTYKEVQSAVLDFIQCSTDRFMPPIGKIKEIINDYRFADVPNENEAFEILINARKKYNIYDSPREGDAYDTLPDAIKRAIGNRKGFISIGNLNTDSAQYGIEKSNFMRIYKSELDRAKKDASRPEWLRKALDANIKKVPALTGSTTHEQGLLSEGQMEDTQVIV